MKKDKVNRRDDESTLEEPTGGGFPISAQGAAEFEAQPGDRVDGKVDAVVTEDAE